MKQMLILLFLFTNCSTQKNEQLSYTDWDIMEKSIQENWSQSKLTSILKTPKAVLSTPNGRKNWFYDDSQSGIQRWSFQFGPQGNIESVTFIPPNLNVGDLVKKWEMFNCQLQSISSNNPHTINKKKYLSCDYDKRRAYINRYDEVESLVINKNTPN